MAVDAERVCELGGEVMVEPDKDIETEPMRHREITLADGRYMIFYTFDEESTEDRQGDDQGEDV
jgi:hypothetical protein